MNFEEIENIFFLGIGGIGMSALARYFNEQEKKVFGYDRTKTILTETLESEGINIIYEETIDLIPANIDLVVYTPAISSKSKLFTCFFDKNIPLIKRAAVLGAICNQGFLIAVAGTHGKTTMSSMIAHLLYSYGPGCTAFIGGVLSNYGTNYLSNNKKIFVVEADEYDRSFHQLHADIAIVSAVDEDHLEIYKTKANVEKAFEQFIDQLKENGVLVSSKKTVLDVNPAVHLKYDLTDSKTDYHTQNLNIVDGRFEWNVVSPKHSGKDLVFSTLINGLHNVENTLPAVAVGELLKMPLDKIKEGIASFKGISRRFEYLWNQDGRVVIDDYAHHPEELDVLIESARVLHPNKEITIVFQPHLYSRTQLLGDAFAEALSKADRVKLVKLYPAREEPIIGINSSWLQQKIKRADNIIYEVKDCANYLVKDNWEILLLAGAGDISKVGKNLINKLRKGDSKWSPKTKNKL